MGKSKKNKKKTDTGTGGPVMSVDPEKARSIFIPLAIAVYTLILFLPAAHHEFINWDDLGYITENPLIRSLSLHNIIEIFKTPVLGMYNPVPFLVYAVVFKFQEYNPIAYNWCNILFHITAMLALYRFIYRLTGKYETATIVAILFAVHPMHVEVVCWDSETKTSLFVTFYFMALIQYLNYINSNYKNKYLVYVALLFIISALSKPGAVTLAPVLLLIDYYLGRKRDPRLFIEKIPFFAISLAFGILTLFTHAQAEDTIFKVSRHYSPFNNLLVSNYSIAFYIEKLLFPFGLCTFYPYPDGSGPLPVQYYIAVVAIPAIALLVYKSGKFRKEMIFGLAFFIITISIVVRLLPSGFFGTANRYSYLSYTGFFFIMGQYYVYIKENRFSYAGSIKKYLPVVLIGYVALCTWICTDRIKVWQNSITVFTDVINHQPRLAMAYDMRGNAESRAGDNNAAIADATRAIELDPGFVQGYNNRTAYRWMAKDFEGARQDCDKALSLDPKSIEAYINRSCLHSSFGLYKEAVADLDTCLQLSPDCALALYNRGIMKIALRDTTGGLADVDRADLLGYLGARKWLQDNRAALVGRQ